jgi:hypothetical protein
VTAEAEKDSSLAAIVSTTADPLLVAWRADATLSCSQCGVLAGGVPGREARPLELRHFVAHGFRPAALSEEGIEAVPWPPGTLG